MTLKEAQQIAFGILTSHGDCLQDDVSLCGLIDDIAAAIMRGSAHEDVARLTTFLDSHKYENDETTIGRVRGVLNGSR